MTNSSELKKIQDLADFVRKKRLSSPALFLTDLVSHMPDLFSYLYDISTPLVSCFAESKNIRAIKLLFNSREAQLFFKNKIKEN